MTVKELYRIFDFPVEIQLIKNGKQIDWVSGHEDDEVKSIKDYYVQIPLADYIEYNKIKMPFSRLVLEVQI